MPGMQTACPPRPSAPSAVSYAGVSATVRLPDPALVLAAGRFDGGGEHRVRRGEPAADLDDVRGEVVVVDDLPVAARVVGDLPPRLHVAGLDGRAGRCLRLHLL